MSRTTAREPTRSALMCKDFARYFMDVIDAILTCASLKQVMNVDESGVRGQPFKGKKRKAVSLASCQTEPRFRTPEISPMFR
jgi:hypothetical protein